MTWIIVAAVLFMWAFSIMCAYWIGWHKGFDCVGSIDAKYERFVRTPPEEELP